MIASATPASADVRQRLDALARRRGGGAAVLSVYLDTRWADEHQRERARIFLKGALAGARAAAADSGTRADLDWIEEQGARLVEQAQYTDAAGVALFACSAIGLRELVAVQAPFGNRFVVADRPALGPLAGIGSGATPALAVFVDGERARLIPFGADGAGDEIVLVHEVLGRHRQGGWALLAQSRYQRHIEVQRAQHFQAVAAELSRLVDEQGIDRLVLAGEARTVAVFRKHLGRTLAARVVGKITAAAHEPAAALVARAATVVAAADRAVLADVVAGVLVEAAKGRRAVAGVDAVLEAVRRNAVRHLYLAQGFEAPGRVCTACDAVEYGDGATCRRCGGATRSVALGQELVGRVIAAGGAVDVVEPAALEAAGGVAAHLRYPLF